MRYSNYRKELPKDAKFWSKCELVAPGIKGQPQKSSPTPDAKRKRITALFSNFTSNTAMTEKLDSDLGE